MVPEKLTFDYDFLGGATYDYVVITKRGGVVTKPEIFFEFRLNFELAFRVGRAVSKCTILETVTSSHLFIRLDRIVCSCMIHRD